MDYVALIKDFGLPVTLVVFFVLQGMKREAHTNLRIDELTKFQQETLIRIIADQNERAAEQNVIIQRFEEILKKVLEFFEK